MPRRIAVDAGPLVALFDRDDQAHRQAVQFFSRWKDRGFVTTAVIVEVTHLLSFRSDVPIDFLRWLQSGALEIEELGDDFDRVVTLVAKHATVPMDFADATIVAACERLNVRHVATLDSDFTIYRFQGRQIFHNVFPM